MTNYSLQEVYWHYKWLDHRRYSELFAYDPRYKPGKENFEYNLENKTLPITRYATRWSQVRSFIEEHHESRMVCISINPRPSDFKNKRGYPRSAKDTEIEVSKSLLIDIDFEARNVSPTQKRELGEFLIGPVAAYFSDLGLNQPVIADSGKGYHLNLAYPDTLGSNLKSDIADERVA